MFSKNVEECMAPLPLPGYAYVVHMDYVENY